MFGGTEHLRSERHVLPILSRSLPTPTLPMQVCPGGDEHTDAALRFSHDWPYDMLLQMHILRTLHNCMPSPPNVERDQKEYVLMYSARCQKNYAAGERIPRIYLKPPKRHIYERVVAVTHHTLRSRELAATSH